MQRRTEGSRLHVCDDMFDMRTCILGFEPRPPSCYRADCRSVQIRAHYNAMGVNNSRHDAKKCEYPSTSVLNKENIPMYISLPQNSKCTQNMYVMLREN